MASVPIKGEANTYQARVSIRTLYEATQMIRRGALTNDMILTTYRIMDKKFNAHMASVGKRKELKHMFDWGMAGSVNGRLWTTFLAGQASNKIVSYKFINSRKRVPLDEENPYLARRFVFKKKAEVFETGNHGKPLRISVRYAKYLSYVNRQRGAGYTSGNGKTYKRDNVTLTQRSSTINSPANGVFEGQFNKVFLAYWANLGTVNELADTLSKSSSTSFARAASARKRVSAYQAKMDAGPEAKKQAEKAITDIKRKMRGVK